MPVIALGYLGFGVKDIAAWRTYASAVLGMQVNEAAEGGLKLRADTRDWRIAIEPSGEDDLIFAGWEVAGPASFEEMIERLGAAGTEVTRDDGTLAKIRNVMAVASFSDPSGIRGEIFWGARDLPESPFVSPAGVRGFVTGELGLGHIVVGARDMGEMARFYADVLGFRYSDRIDMTVGPDMKIPVDFWHCNPRHHTLAFAPTPPGAQKLIHFMLQTTHFDDVGLAIDRCEKAGVQFATTLGRHNNDHMLSFYAYTPSGFEIEYGYGARDIDDRTWVPACYDATSTWGHKFVGHGMQRG